MRIEEVTWRLNKYFHFKARCEGCGAEKVYADGFADDYFCQRIVPSRRCPACHESSRTIMGMLLNGEIELWIPGAPQGTRRPSIPPQ